MTVQLFQQARTTRNIQGKCLHRGQTKVSWKITLERSVLGSKEIEQSRVETDLANYLPSSTGLSGVLVLFVQSDIAQSFSSDKNKQKDT